MRTFIVLFCFVSLSSPTAYSASNLQFDMKTCLANADIKAKAAAEIHSKEAIRIYKQMFDEEQKSEYAKCALEYADK